MKRIGKFLIAPAVFVAGLSVTLPASADAGNAAAALTLNKDVQVIMLNFSDVQNPMQSSQALQGQLFGSSGSLSEFFTQASYGKLKLTGKVFGPFTIPLAQTCDAAQVFTPAITAARADPNFIDDNQQPIVIIAPFGPVPCGWVGYSAGYNHLIAVSTSAPGFLRAVAHELGHDLGLLHASSYDCGTVAVAVNTSACQMDEYGDTYDVMGSDIPGVADFNGVQKEFLGWLNAGNEQMVSGNGTFALQPIEISSSNLKVLKIPRKVNEYLYVEYRQPVGADQDLGANASNVFSGALLHIAPNNSPKSYLINPNPSSGAGDIALAVGQNFTDPLTNTAISVVSQTSQALTVRVTLGSRVWALGDLQATAANLTFLPPGSLIADKGTIYIIHGQNKQAFANSKAFLGLGYSFKNVTAADGSFYNLSGRPIASANVPHPAGSWIKADKTVYYVSPDGLVPVPSWQIFTGNGGFAAMLTQANAFDLKILKAQPLSAPLAMGDDRLQR